MFQKALTYLIVASLLTPSLSVAETKEQHYIYGRDIAESFANSCSEKNFGSFMSWAVKNKFLNLQIPDNEATIEVLDAGTALVYTPDYQYSISKEGRMRLTVDKVVAYGDDACEAFVNYVNRKEFSKKFALNTFLEFLIPSAFALSQQGQSAVDAIRLGKVASGGGMSNAVKAIGIGVATGLVGLGIAAAFGVFGSNKTKKRFNNFIKGKPQIQSCSESETILVSGKRRITVTKQNGQVSMSMYDTAKGKVIATDKKAKKKAKKAYAKIADLAKACSSEEDAGDMNRRMAGETATAVAAVQSATTTAAASTSSEVASTPSPESTGASQ